MRDDQETTELRLALHHETGGAVLVSDDGDRESAVWLPKSQVRRGELVGSGLPRVYLWDVPVWLAEKEGLV